jgi:hypothetical protein
MAENQLRSSVNSTATTYFDFKTSPGGVFFSHWQNPMRRCRAIRSTNRFNPTRRNSEIASVDR